MPLLTDEEKLQIAKEDGTVGELAKRHGYSTTAITEWRKRFGLQPSAPARQRSPAYQHLEDEYATLLAKPPIWSVLAATLNDKGMRRPDGRPLDGDILRKTWVRVCEKKERANETKRAREAT